jgi:hypothetical protein
MKNIQNTINVGLNTMYGDPTRISEVLKVRKMQALIWLPVLAFAFSCGQINSDNYIPWWAGFIVGSLWGGLFGFIGVWIIVKLFYVFYWFGHQQTKMYVYENMMYASFGPLLFFAFTGLTFHFGGIYFSVSWYSGTVFMVLGLLWSGFTAARLFYTDSKVHISTLILSLFYIVSFLLIITYLFPIIQNEIILLIRSIPFINNKVLIV